MLIKTTAQTKISRLRKRTRICQGGTSSSKTFSIIPILIHYAIMNPKSEISIVSESVPHLRRGAVKDFIKIMDWTDNWNPNNWNKSNQIYQFSNGSYIEFFSADNPSKLRGARRDILFINECNNVPFEAYQQLSIRTKKFIYLDYNPTNEFWVHTELIGLPNSDFVKLTYHDNEALDKSIFDELERAKERAKTSKYWENWYKVYGLGELGQLDGLIFQNWQTIDAIPQDAKYVGSGMDFGYSQDPTTLIDVWQIDNQYIFNEIIYQTGLTNNDIAKLSKEITLVEDGKEKIIKRIIYADSAEPKSIVEIANYGVAIYGAKKGADSINYGIQLLQGQKFLVTSKSTNLIKELRNYMWDKDREGRSINKPIDIYNHCVDGLRYWAMETLGGRGKIDIR